MYFSFAASLGLKDEQRWSDLAPFHYIKAKYKEDKFKFMYFSFAASLGLKDEQKHIQQMATDFARNELFPNMAKWDQEVNPYQLHHEKIWFLHIYAKTKAQISCAAADLYPCFS